MSNVQKLNYDESIVKLKDLQNWLSKWNQEKLEEVLSKIPQKLWENYKKVISEHTNRLIESILFFRRMYKNEDGNIVLNWVIREAIISFRYDVKHCL